MKQTLIAYELDEPLAALMSSSARHSAIDLTLRKADSRVYSNQVIPTFTTPQKGDSTYTNGNESNSLVDSAKRWHIDSLTTNSPLRTNTSRVFTGTSIDNGIDENLGSARRFNHFSSLDVPELRTWMGFWSVSRWMISKAWATMRTAKSFFPLLRPFIIKLNKS